MCIRTIVHRFMTGLRSLEVECRAMWIPCQLITDVTGYFALVHLTTLKKLKVTEIGVPEKFDASDSLPVCSGEFS